MIFKKTNFLSPKEKKDIFLLWNDEYPATLHYKDIQELQNYLDSLKDHFHLLLIAEDGRVKGWYFDFIRDQQRWFATILGHELQRKGFGSRLLDMAKEKRPELHGWVITENCKKSNGNFYLSPLDFYKKNKFTVRKEIQLKTKIISAVKIEWHKDEEIKTSCVRN